MEGFFYQCRAVSSPAELTEFVYRTYQGAARDILRLPWREGAELIREGREQAQRRKFWLMYCNMYPHMTEESFIEFDKWYEGLKKAPVQDRPVQDIMADVNKIINMTLA